MLCYPTGWPGQSHLLATSHFVIHQAFKRPTKMIQRLSAHHSGPLSKDVGGNAGDAEPARLFLGGVAPAGVLARGQRLPKSIAVETHLCRQSAEYAEVTDIL